MVDGNQLDGGLVEVAGLAVVGFAGAGGVVMAAGADVGGWLRTRLRGVRSTNT